MHFKRSSSSQRRLSRQCFSRLVLSELLVSISLGVATLPSSVQATRRWYEGHVLGSLIELVSEGRDTCTGSVSQSCSSVSLGDLLLIHRQPSTRGTRWGGTDLVALLGDTRDGSLDGLADVRGGVGDLVGDSSGGRRVGSSRPVHDRVSWVLGEEGVGEYSHDMG